MYFIRNTKDLVLGVISLGVSLWLVFDESIVKGFTLSNTTFLARPDVYVRAIATGWAILSVLLILKSVNLTGKKVERVKFSFRMPLVTILPMIAFVIYILVLEQMGFFISSFVFMTFICLVYQLKEKNLTLKLHKEFYKSVAISCGFSIIMVFVIGEMFSKLLKVTLP